MQLYPSPASAHQPLRGIIFSESGFTELKDLQDNCKHQVSSRRDDMFIGERVMDDATPTGSNSMADVA
jgi:hypothetical protein